MKDHNYWYHITKITVVNNLHVTLYCICVTCRLYINDIGDIDYINYINYINYFFL